MVTLVEASCQATQKCCVWEVPEGRSGIHAGDLNRPTGFGPRGSGLLLCRQFRTQGILLRVPSDIGGKIWDRTRNSKDMRVFLDIPIPSLQLPLAIAPIHAYTREAWEADVLLLASLMHTYWRQEIFIYWQAPMYQKHNTTVKASKKRKMACQQKKILRFFKNIILIFHIIFPCAQISADFF